MQAPGGDSLPQEIAAGLSILSSLALEDAQGDDGFRSSQLQQDSQDEEGSEDLPDEEGSEDLPDDAIQEISNDIPLMNSGEERQEKPCWILRPKCNRMHSATKSNVERTYRPSWFHVLE